MKLSVENLEVAYGKVRAVHGATLSVDDGQLVAVIGANGAGKSSILHAVCGIERPHAGRVVLEDSDITGIPYHRLVRRGLVLVPEGRQLVAGLSVEETLMLGAAAARMPGRQARRRMAEVLALVPMLADRLGDRAGLLSGGQAQMLALARGLMSAPRLLLLDEPSLGLSPRAIRELFALIDALNRQGLTILMVEQNVRQALAIAGYGYVIESGRVSLEGPARELAENSVLVASYLGVAREDTREEPTP
jgi:branched-chain amino acid transport system ATP-binding protein